MVFKSFPDPLLLADLIGELIRINYPRWVVEIISPRRIFISCGRSGSMILTKYCVTVGEECLVIKLTRQ